MSYSQKKVRSNCSQHCDKYSSYFKLLGELFKMQIPSLYLFMRKFLTSTSVSSKSDFPISPLKWATLGFCCWAIGGLASGFPLSTRLSSPSCQSCVWSNYQTIKLWFLHLCKGDRKCLFCCTDTI